MSAPAWVDELDLHAGPPEAAMGTRVLDESRWFLVDDEWAAQRDEARALLQTRRAEVLAGAVPDADAELDARIRDWLGVDDAVEDRDALARARSRVADDLCLLTPSDEGWLLAAGAVCFPSYWRLGEKVGRPLAAVHDSVPGYPGPFAGRVDGFLGRLRPGQGVWRRNWSIHDVPDLHLPSHPVTTAGPARWLRSEYQTLLRLEEAAAVVFTIRTQQVPLTDLADRPDVCAGLASAVRGWTPAQGAYKGSAVDGAVLTWLDAPVHRDR
jgi:hypothetical protein